MKQPDPILAPEQERSGDTFPDPETTHPDAAPTDNSTSAPPEAGRSLRRLIDRAHQFRLARFAAVVLSAIALAAALLIVPPPYSTVALVTVSAGAWLVALLARRFGQQRLIRVLRWPWTQVQCGANTLGMATAPLVRRILREGDTSLVRQRWRARAARLLRAMVSPAPHPVADDVRRAERRLRPALLHLELGLVIVFALYGAREFADMNMDLQLPGHEAEWLTNAAYFATQSLREVGRIPLWQPYFERGEPLVTGPFSFVLNPFSFAPSLFVGPINGIKISVILTALLAGLGGWVLGRVLGFGSLGRVMLGLLMVGKGNMHSMIGTGYFQLGVTQAYFPWIIAGMWATLRFHHRRWPLVMVATAYSLMYFGGNIWYTLPMLISMVVLTLVYIVRPQAGGAVDWLALRRAAIAGVLTLGLSAILFLPQWAYHDYIGGHKDLIGGGEPVDRRAVIEQFYDGSLDLYIKDEAPGDAQFYYSFTSPLWYLLLIFILFPWALPFREAVLGRLWLVAVVMLIGCTLWGVGGHPIFAWLYKHVPLLGQWRFVGRALAVSSFWLAVIVAMRVDSLWARLTGALPARRWPLRAGLWGVRSVVLVFLIGASLLAAREVIREWHTFTGLGPRRHDHDQYITWLKQQSDREMAGVYEHGYTATTAYIENGIRLYNIEADYIPLSEPWTLGATDLTGLLPRYGISWDGSVTRWLENNGYERFAYTDERDYPYFYRNPEALPYAFLVTPMALENAAHANALFTEAIPIDTFQHDLDIIHVQVGDPISTLVLVAQERAYPGWTVEVDERRATLESVGGLIGVVLEPTGADSPRVIRFAYRPAPYYVGAALTLLTIGVMIAALLNGDRMLLRYVRRWRAARLAAS
ncbi:MAG: hypothetical protein GX613_17975 [Chloroflexi bacterium]|nr:hypothetical protein [Chloroflexota bacterium]